MLAGAGAGGKQLKVKVKELARPEPGGLKPWTAPVVAAATRIASLLMLMCMFLE
jgi:hypothetical protein